MGHVAGVIIHALVARVEVLVGRMEDGGLDAVDGATAVTGLKHFGLGLVFVGVVHALAPSADRDRHRDVSPPGLDIAAAVAGGFGVCNCNGGSAAARTLTGVLGCAGRGSSSWGAGL